MLKIMDTCTIGEKRFAILVNEENMEAYEAIWDGENWETDFSYDSLGIDSFEVAGAMDFEGVEKMGYTFVI